ncbi:retrovirus-related pol polyprotein from transposon TNT 1-94 [Tanacetum coccineum]
MDSDKYLEGQSMQRPPLFESDHFTYWKKRFETYMKAKDLDLWHIILNDNIPPVAKNKVTQILEVVPFEEQSNDLKKKLAKNNEAKMVLYNALLKKEYERIFMCKTAKDIWQSLLITHQAENNVKKFLRTLTSKMEEQRQPREEKKSFRQRDEKKGKSGQKCFRCGDLNHLIGNCPKPSRNKDQKAFIGVTLNSFLYSDNASSLDNDSMQIECDSLCEISLKIINKNKILKTKRDLLEKEILELNEKIKKLERSKEIEIVYKSCEELKSKNAKLKETQVKFVKFDKSVNSLREMLNNQKSPSCKIGLGFDDSKASTSETKNMSFVGSSAEKATDGSTIKVHRSTLLGSMSRTYGEKGTKHVFSPPMSSISDFVITRKKLIHNSIDESKKPSLKPSPKSDIEQHRTGAWDQDNGCSKHMTGNKSLLSTYKAYDGEHVDNLAFNLLNVGQICDNKCQVLFTEEGSEIIKDGITMGNGIRKNGLYIMKLGNESQEKLCLATVVDNSTLWHRRLGHANMRLIKSLLSKELVRNLPKLKYNKHFCDACKIGKKAHASHKAKNMVSSKRSLELLHMDLFGPSAIKSYRGNLHTLVVVDDYSRYTWTRFLKTKNESFEKFEILSKKIQNQLGSSIIAIRTDHGREFDNEVQFGAYCDAQGITQNFSAPRTAQSNGVVERKNRTLQEMSRTMLNEQSIP